MTQLTAKPFTARPLAARPFTAYPFGESTSVSNPLVWHAAYPDADGVMQAQITGSGTPSFTVDDGLLLPDHEGIYRTTAEDTAPWHGARKVVNLACDYITTEAQKLNSSDDLTGQPAGTAVTAEFTGESTIFSCTSDASYVRFCKAAGASNMFAAAGQKYVVTFEARGIGESIGRLIAIHAETTGDVPTAPTVTLSGEYQRICLTRTKINSNSDNIYIALGLGSGTVASGEQVEIRRVQIELVNGQSNQSPGEYVYAAKTIASGDYTGASKYFSYENGNTVSSNVVVPAKGATLDPLPSLYGGPSYTNSLTYSNDLTNAAWTKYLAPTVTLDEPGLTGAPNTASKLASAAISYCSQSIATTSGQQVTATLRLKKQAGQDLAGFAIWFNGSSSTRYQVTINQNTGAVVEAFTTSTTYGYEVIDGGADWVLHITGTLTGSTSAWVVVFNSYTSVTSTTIVKNISAHAGKTIAAVRGSAPIITAASTVTTTAISMSYDIANHSDTQGAYYCEWVPFASGSDVPNTDNPFLTLANTAYGPMNYRGNNTVGGHDSAYHKTEVSLAWVAETEHKRATVYDSSESKLVTNVDGTYDATEVTNYTGLFVGPYTGLKILYNQSTVSLIRNIRRYNLNYTAAKAKITELMS